MMPKNQALLVRVTFVVIMVCTILLIARSLPLARADGGGPPLPPRYPPPATPAIGDDDGDDDHNPPPGAYIELQTQSAPAQAWTVVQWQDGGGNWHEVEGWQGALEANGSKRWWVAVKDFGTGPFRWIIKTRNDSQPLATSVLFNLPNEAYQVVQVEVVLDR